MFSVVDFTEQKELSEGQTKAPKNFAAVEVYDTQQLFWARYVERIPPPPDEGYDGDAMRWTDLMFSGVELLNDPAILARYGELREVSILVSPWLWKHGDGVAFSTTWIDVAENETGKTVLMCQLTDGRIIKPPEPRARRGKTHRYYWTRVFTAPEDGPIGL